MMNSAGRLPVSLRMIVVGMPLGKSRIVLIASLKMVCSLPFSSLVSFQLSHAYVRIGIMIVSTICLIALIFMPFNFYFWLQPVCGLFPLSLSLRSQLFDLIGYIYCLLFHRGICMRGLLLVSLHWALGRSSFLFLSFLLLCILTLQIGCGIHSRHYSLYGVFFVPWGHSVLGRHRPSRVESLHWGSAWLEIWDFIVWALWLCYLLGLHILLLIVLPFVLYCLLYWISLSISSLDSGGQVGVNSFYHS